MPFPKGGCDILAHKAGAKAIIQPGGSIADQEIIAFCDKYKIAMVITGLRHCGGLIDPDLAFIRKF